MNKKLQVVNLARFSGHSGSIYGLYYSKAKNRIYTGASDGYVVEWDPLKPDEGVLIARLQQPVYSIYLVEESQILWVGTADGHIHLIDLRQGVEIRNLAIHHSGIFDLKENNGIIYAAGGDGRISSYNAYTGDFIQVIKVSDKSIRCLAIGIQKDVLAYGSSDWSLGVLSKNLDIISKVESAHSNSVFSLTYSRDGQYLLSGGRDAMLRVWATSEPLELIKEIPAHNLHVHAIAIHEDNGFFLTSSMDKTIKIWDLHSFQLLKVLDKMRNQSHTNSVNKIAWIDAKTFVSISDDKMLLTWELIS